MWVYGGGNTDYTDYHQTVYDMSKSPEWQNPSALQHQVEEKLLYLLSV